ncbi:hypothetical protein H8R18_06580 [Nanchangia anserum]|uniref:Uncharacterized protein n=1 Tax=Nanchangia anserum TaxID=2692125 RepID=A0A8I0KU11_9ACTO|nr:hypothetical protein [Nanchangia anserum]MBD3689198.1 hypothetical protein [Nanchangia anserum]QOX81424.1 hypothetical protein H8R18_06580 [Nanchangia anserum]
MFPVGTDTIATLSVGVDAGNKADLIDSLDRSLTAAHVSAYRIDDSGRDRVVYYRFGKNAQVLDSGLRDRPARIIGGRDLGDLSLSGSYALTPSSPATQQTLARWANAHNVGISFDKDQSGLGVFLAGIVRTSLGLGLLSVLLLGAACVTTWYGTRVRERGLRFISGQSRARLEAEDFRSCWGRLFCGVIIGGCLAVVAGALTFAGSGFSSYCRQLLVVTLAITVIFGILCVAAGWLVKPGVQVITREAIGRDSLGASSLALRVIALVIASSLVPIAVNAYASARDTGDRIADAAALGDVTRVSVSSVADEDTVRDGANAAATRWVSELERRNAVLVSYPLDSGFEVSESLRGYSHLVLVDAATFERLKSRGLRLSSAPESAVSEMDITMEPWLREGADLTDVKYYVGSGINVPILGQTSAASFAVSNDHPLLAVLPHGVAKTLNGDALIALAANGGLVVSDPGIAHDTLRATGMDAYTVSVDRVLPELREQQRDALREAQIGIIALVITLLSLLVGLVQTAAMWSARHSQLITVRRLAGHRLAQVARGKWFAEMCLALLALGVASGIALADVTLPRYLIAMTALVLGCVYALASAVVLLRSVARSAVLAVERRI